MFKTAKPKNSTPKGAPLSTAFLPQGGKLPNMTWDDVDTPQEKELLKVAMDHGGQYVSFDMDSGEIQNFYRSADNKITPKNPYNLTVGGTLNKKMVADLSKIAEALETGGLLVMSTVTSLDPGPAGSDMAQLADLAGISPALGAFMFDNNKAKSTKNHTMMIHHDAATNSVHIVNVDANARMNTFSQNGAFPSISTLSYTNTGPGRGIVATKKTENGRFAPDGQDMGLTLRGIGPVGTGFRKNPKRENENDDRNLADLVQDMVKLEKTKEMKERAKFSAPRMG